MRATIYGCEIVWPKPIGSGDVLVRADRERFVDEDVARDCRASRSSTASSAMPCSRRRSTMRVRVRADVMPMPRRCRDRSTPTPATLHRRHLRVVRQIDLQRRDRHEAVRDGVEIGALARVLRAAPAAPTQYTVSPRGVVALTTSSALWRRPSRVTRCRAALRAAMSGTLTLSSRAAERLRREALRRSRRRRAAAVSKCRCRLRRERDRDRRNAEQKAFGRGGDGARVDRVVAHVRAVG